MSEFGLIRDSDWSALLRLAGEVSELPADVRLRREHILESLCDLVGCYGAVVFDFAGPDEPRIARPESIVGVRLPDDHAAAISGYLTSPGSVNDGFNQYATPAMAKHGTAPRRWFIEDTEWHRTENFLRTTDGFPIDDRIHSVIMLPGGQRSSLTLAREKGDRDFSRKECQLVTLFHSHAGGLYSLPRSPGAAAAESLPPRLKRVLEHLLRGDGEKQIAFKLKLSRHTIHEYVKWLYRHYDVCSRGELLARFHST